MVAVDRRSVIGESSLRAAVFVGICGGLTVAGYHLNGYDGPQIPLGLALLATLLVVMALQAYTNGSSLLPVLLSPAPVFAFWLPTTMLTPGPALYFKTAIAVTVGLLFGLTGHLIGVVLAERGRTGERSITVGTYFVAALLLLVSVLWYLM